MQFVDRMGFLKTSSKERKSQNLDSCVQGFVPGVLGISHGSLQFMAYEQMKTLYNHRRNQPLDAKLVSSLSQRS